MCKQCRTEAYHTLFPQEWTSIYSLFWNKGNFPQFHMIKTKPNVPARISGICSSLNTHGHVWQATLAVQELLLVSLRAARWGAASQAVTYMTSQVPIVPKGLPIFSKYSCSQNLKQVPTPHCKNRFTNWVPTFPIDVPNLLQINKISHFISLNNVNSFSYRTISWDILKMSYLKTYFSPIVCDDRRFLLVHVDIWADLTCDTWAVGWLKECHHEMW